MQNTNNTEKKIHYIGIINSSDKRNLAELNLAYPTKIMLKYR
jgi:hypothetical protein